MNEEESVGGLRASVVCLAAGRECGLSVRQTPSAELQKRGSKMPTKKGNSLQRSPRFDGMSHHVFWRVVSRIASFSLLTLVAIKPQTCQAQSRLAKLSAEQKADDYYVIVQKVVHRIYDSDVVVSELFTGTGDEESATGVLKTAKGYEAFALFASPSVWQTEYSRFLQGTKEHCVDDAGKTIPCPSPARSKSTRRSYHDIKAIIKTRFLSAEVAGRIEGVWQRRVLEALRHPTFSKYENIIGGFEHYYSVRSKNHNWVTVLGQDSDENTDPGRMAALARALRGYALGVVSEIGLKKDLARAERNASVPHQRR